MTVVSLRPNSTIVNTGTVAGGGVAHTVLSDDTDSGSYITLTGAQGWAGALTDLTLPAGAVLMSATLRIRAQRTGGTSGVYASITGRVELGLPVDPANSVLINWTADPVTVTFLTTTEVSDASLDSAVVQVSQSAGVATARVYEVYLDTKYAEKPVVTVDAPAGTVTDTNLPTVAWTPDLDADGGPQTAYQVWVYTDAQYSDGGFAPGVSTAIDSNLSGITFAADTSWRVGTILPDDTYRAYVRIAQTVNGALHWSDWDYSEFEVDVALPGEPIITLTPEPEMGRIKIEIDTFDLGAADTDYYELVRELHASESAEYGQVPLRQLTAGLLPKDGVVTVYDYEMPVDGEPVIYWVRALHDYSGVLAASDWVVDGTFIVLTTWWLKHPNKPALNMPVVVRGLPSVTRAARQGTFQPLGSSRAVVVSDKRGAPAGTVTLRALSLAVQADLDALLDEVATLFLQSPSNGGGPGYVRIGNHDRQRIIEQGDATRMWEALEFVVVPSPLGDVVAWPP